MRASLALIAVLAFGGAGARAQDAIPEREPTPGEIATLRARGRTVMHPSATPLKVSPRESDANDMRSKSPALKQGDLTPKTVGGDENYRRAIAMVEHRAMYTTPPRATTASETSPDDDASSAAGAEAATTKQTTAPASESRTGLVWGSLGAFLLLVLGWSFVRRGE